MLTNIKSSDIMRTYRERYSIRYIKAVKRRVAAMVVSESRRGWNGGTDLRVKNISEPPTESDICK